jgi:hypothetical protein
MKKPTPSKKLNLDTSTVVILQDERQLAESIGGVRNRCASSQTTGPNTCQP